MGRRGNGGEKDGREVKQRGKGGKGKWRKRGRGGWRRGGVVSGVGLINKVN